MRRPTDAMNITAWQLQLRVTMPHCLICTLPTQHLSCSSRRRQQRWGGIAPWVASTAALPYPRRHARIESGWKPRVISSSSWMDGQSPGLLGEGSWLCFKHPVVRCQVLGTDLCSSAVLTLSLLLSTFPMGYTPTFCTANRMFRLRNKKCFETGPDQRCSRPKQYQKRFWYYH